MPYYHIQTGELILGTIEQLIAVYPITKSSESGKWTYSGADCAIVYGSAEIVRNAQGLPMFQTTSGRVVPENEIEWKAV